MNLGPVGGRCLANVVSECVNLREVHAAGNGFAQMTIKALAESLPRCRNLDSLYLRGGHAGDAAIGGGCVG